MPRMSEISTLCVQPYGKRKANFWDLMTGNEIQYSQFGRIRLNGQKGTFYKLCTKLSTERVNELCGLYYSNVTFFGGRAAYAPEFTFQYLFIADKKFNAKGSN